VSVTRALSAHVRRGPHETSRPVREDIHPLEEALGFKSLLKLGEPYNIAHIAARAGKSEAYIYGRLKLADLIPSVAEAFLKDEITIGHALLIAKLQASQQQEAFAAAFRGMWTSEGNSQVLIPVRELAAWIESNILLQLASVPFDKQDETLVPAAGSCVNCPKRTGFNKLLFADISKDSCTDPQCFRAKVDAHIAKTLEKKPELVQISSAWNTRESAPLGRSHYVELHVKKPKANGSTAKLPPAQKPCESMTDAMVMDGGNRGHIAKVPVVNSCSLRRLRERKYKAEEIARKLGLDRAYINGIIHLLEKGEEGLAQAVEAGRLPISVAIKIATGNDHEVQQALAEAYENGDLRGDKLRMARRVISLRIAKMRRAGKLAQTRRKLTGDALVREYKDRMREQRQLVQKANLTKERLLLLTSAMRRLMQDEHFLTLLRAENLVDMPEQLAIRLT
jgi:hypothetical protein